MIILAIAELQIICFSYLIFIRLIFIRLILKIHIKRCNEFCSGINFSFFSAIFRNSFLKWETARLHIFFLNDLLYTFYTIKRRTSEFSQSLLTLFSLHLHIAVQSNLVLLSIDVSNICFWFYCYVLYVFFENVKYISIKSFIHSILESHLL